MTQVLDSGNKNRIVYIIVEFIFLVTRNVDFSLMQAFIPKLSKVVAIVGAVYKFKEFS